MKHLADGTLRRLVDEPLAIADSQKVHLNTCSVCGTRYSQIEFDARQARLALEVPAQAPNVSIARARLQEHTASVTPAQRGRYARVFGWRRPAFTRSMGALASAGAVLAAISLTPAGSLAQSFVTVFQPREVAAVQLSSLDIRSLAQLRHYGTIHLPARVSGQRAASAENATKLAGMRVLVPSSVPSGVPASVNYAVSPGASASFTFSATKAMRWAATAGKTLPVMPPRIDGSSIEVSAGSTVVTTYGACATGCSGIPQLIIGQMVAPTVSSSGANVREIEDYVFRLPGVSPQLATELRSIGDPTATLPIPIPSSFAHADPVTVQGVHGEAIGDNTGVGSLVVWEKDGVIYAVGGAMALGQVESIADSLR